ASILFDTLDWSPRTAFDARARLVVRDWRAQGASIAADNLALHINAPPQGDGRVDLTGLARITGPVGDGMVRDLTADLDLGVSFGARGWRVAPNQGCVPVRLSGLEVVGLSFQGGAFQLCPSTDGALIAADASNALSGGFSIAGLHLDGHMGGPNGQPARLSSTQ